MSGFLIFRFHRLSYSNPQLPKFKTQRLAGNSEKSSRLVLASADIFKNTGQQKLIQFPMGFGI